MDGDIEWGGCLSRMKGLGKASTGDSCMAGKTEDRKMKDRGRVEHVHRRESNRGDVGKSGVQGSSGGGGEWG